MLQHNSQPRHSDDPSSAHTSHRQNNDGSGEVSAGCTSGSIGLSDLMSQSAKNRTLTHLKHLPHLFPHH
uniref:Uncharacterized protein n=1 Tax=Rhizophora mucronata TaxID=61149 RepID=A0A2P2LN69_RHIMU